MSGLRYQKRGNAWLYSFDGAMVDGKRQFISKGGFRTKKEATVAGIKALEEYNRAGAVFNPTDISFSDYLDLWMKQYVMVNCKAVTVLSYEKKIRLHIKPTLGKYKLSSLNPLVLQQLIDEKFNAGYSRNSLAIMKGILTGCLAYAVQPLGYLQHSPAVYLKLPSTRAEGRVKTRSCPRTIVPKEAMMRILECFPEGSSSHIPLQIGYKCGMRLGEVFGLTWDCVDFKNMTIAIDKQIQWQERDKQTGEKGYWYFTAPKYLSSRTIRMPNDLAELLKREFERQQAAMNLYGNLYTHNYVDERQRLNQDAHGTQVNLVMVRLDGTYIISRNMHYVSHIVSHELGIEKFDFHSLRHTHATMLAEIGATPKYVQHRLGHKNIQVTMQVYQHLTPLIEDKNVELLNKL